jgi:hypothetical protein
MLGQGRLSRREREFRQVLRVTLTIGVLVSVAVGTLLNALAPRSKPLVTVYTREDCDTCRRWMQDIEAQGFRTERGSESDWPLVRAEFGLPPELRSSLTAVVDGLLIEGPVPARDIHRALQLRSSYDVRGLAVPGVPRGSPGNDSFTPEHYKVFVVRGGGRVHEFAVHGG